MNNDMRRPRKGGFRHFHDFYSNTYPRYESYTSIERENDIYNMIRSEIQNNNVIFQNNLYYDSYGNINPLFKQNVISALEEGITPDF